MEDPYDERSNPGDLDDDDGSPSLCAPSHDESQPIAVKTMEELAAYIKAQQHRPYDPECPGPTMAMLAMSIPFIPVSTPAWDLRNIDGVNAAKLAGLSYTEDPYDASKGVNGFVKHDVLSKYLTYSEDRQPAAGG
jgi:hypothetical protein